MEKKVVELFAGVGGFRVGLNNVKLENNEKTEDKNWDFVWVNQWEPSKKVQHAFDCYNKRFGNESFHVNEDISKIDKNTIPNHTLLVGGFPCQDYSVARSLSKEKGIEGKKGVLWWEIRDVLEAKRPPFVLLENVDRLLKSPSTQRGRDFGIMLRTFADLGYSVEWRIINAAEYGLAQKRRRVFIFAFHESTKFNNSLCNSNFEEWIHSNGFFQDQFKIVSDYKKYNPIISDISENTYKDLVSVSSSFKLSFYNSGVMHKHTIYTEEVKPIDIAPTTLGQIRYDGFVDKKYFLGTNLEKWKYLKGAKKIERVKPNGEIYYYTEGGMGFPDDLDKPGRTMLTSESSVNRSTHVITDLKTNEMRLLVPIEAERLNCFPDDWTNTGMPDKARYFMMGNALVTGLVKKMGNTLDKIFKNE